MKLYYSPGTCSLSPHVSLIESGLPFTAVRVSTKTHKLADGGDFYAINPKGYVPVLELDDGARLTEGPAIVQYIADRAPEKKLAPPAGTLERARLQEWLNFITSELHKSYSPLFNADMPEAAKVIFRNKIGDRLKWVDAQLEGRTWLMGDAFSVADPYLFVVAGWSPHVGVDLAPYARLGAFMKRMSERPSVKQALAAEVPPK